MKWLKVFGSLLLITICIVLFLKFTNSYSEEVIIADSKQIEEAYYQKQKVNETVDLSSQEKKIICIDPGHQKKGDYNEEPIGPGASTTKPRVSSGTQGVSTGMPEYQLNLEFSLRLKVALEEQGYIVVLTREVNDVDLSNKERAEIANSSDADIFLRIHADGSSSSEASGISVLCPDENCEYTKEIFERSEYLAHCIHDEMVKATTAKARGLIYRKDISGFNWSKVPVVLIELGFMTNPDEDKKLWDTEYQSKLVMGIIGGVEIYFDDTDY